MSIVSSRVATERDRAFIRPDHLAVRIHNLPILRPCNRMVTDNGTARNLGAYPFHLIRSARSLPQGLDPYKEPWRARPISLSPVSPASV